VKPSPTWRPTTASVPKPCASRRPELAIIEMQRDIRPVLVFAAEVAAWHPKQPSLLPSPSPFSDTISLNQESSSRPSAPASATSCAGRSPAPTWKQLLLRLAGPSVRARPVREGSSASSATRGCGEINPSVNTAVHSPRKHPTVSCSSMLPANGRLCLLVGSQAFDNPHRCSRRARSARPRRFCASSPRRTRAGCTCWQPLPTPLNP